MFWTPAPVPDPDPGFAGVTAWFKGIFLGLTALSRFASLSRESIIHPGKSKEEATGKRARLCAREAQNPVSPAGEETGQLIGEAQMAGEDILTPAVFEDDAWDRQSNVP